jgi:hypothetical protein
MTIPSVLDPVTGTFVPADGGQHSIETLLFQILVELRIANHYTSEKLGWDAPHELSSLRNDALVDPNFFQQR